MHKELKGWIEFLGIKEPELEALHGDAGSRCYYRITNKPTKDFLVMDASEDTKSVPLFIGVGMRLMEYGIRIPQMKSYELHKGFMLLEDVGSTHLYDKCGDENIRGYYEKAIANIVKMQKAPHQGLAVYDREFLIDEMNIMQEWYLKAYLGKSLECVQGRRLLEMFALISKEVMAQPQETFVHRDYHSKNLMIDSNDALVLIDFQDARSGGVTYDLVSLLRDAYVGFDKRELKRLIKLFIELKGLEVDEETFMRWFDFTALQRHIKILGIFARLSLRDGKDEYLQYMPLVRQYIANVIAKYPELEGLEFILDAKCQA
ncbi:COG3178: Predicted phosphotransferase related to Ser/Thr protein kinases [hydrothermal vent metagenome]|uniref:COG3178: Predicted phosphotransferase related to Ser/Thr protein kinases n=1 Tax=hydrothermal vent metagenome TaxID=652676 RepID=A0A1W1CGM8_9ZZZZ